MTRQASFKARVRERMRKTGERYTTARAVLLRESAGAETPAQPGVIPGWDGFGGVQSDTAILRRVFAHAGIRHPATGEPYGEAMLHGLCGGVGFLYAVFEYKGWAPMLTMVLRSRSMPNTYIADVFDRVGAVRDVSTTGSDAVAARALDAALDAGRPALCIVDAARLPWSGVPREMTGAGPHHVAVIGRDGDRYWLDDRALRPISLGRDDLVAARGAYGKAKRWMATVEPAKGDVDWRAALRGAIADTARTLRDGDPTIPASFRMNTGLAGIEKWQRLLTDERDKKGWPRVFAGGANAFAGLRRAYDCIQHDYTAPGGGRGFYADFLDEAAGLLDAPALSDAAHLFRESGGAWTAAAGIVADAPDDALRRACAIADERAEALDAGDLDAIPPLTTERAGLAASCTLDAATARDVYARLAERAGEILDLERRAAGLLSTSAA